ncbi:hypothetical protein BGZ83_009857 [Gryganskiella cystojenkinii]|nr:hypothetical protein BGZ83_009857 [Gryganskiella cystojenkinii]
MSNQAQDMPSKNNLQDSSNTQNPQLASSQVNAGTSSSAIQHNLQQISTPQGNYSDDDDYNLDDEDEDEDEEDGDYYDPHEDLERHYEQNLLIEQSWLDWERQSSVNNIQSPHRQPYNPRQPQYRYNIFQKPGSVKRRDRRERWALAHYNAQMASAASAASASRSAAAAGSSSSVLDHGSSVVVEKLRRLGTYRPALASSIVHSYTNAQSWEAAQAAREQRLAAKSINGTGENIICTLPVELLTHVLSYLEPIDLFSVSLVCQLLYHVVNADSCWKGAFIKFFGVSIPFKRLDPKSWRSEYIKRTRLLRRWEKGRGSNVTINPQIGQVSKLWTELDNRPNEGWFLAGGLAQGVVARCDPLLGKVQKDAVFRTFHLVNSEVVVMAMDRHRVLWGLTTGQVCLTTLAYAAAGQTFQTFAGFHAGPVSCVKLVPNQLGFALTGGVDGVVKLWDVSRTRCVREFRTGLNLVGNTTAKITHICCEPTSRIVAGTSTGEIYIWEVDISSIIAPPSAPGSGASSPARTPSTDNMHSTTTTPAAIASPDPSLLSSMLPAPKLPKVIQLPEEFKGVAYLEIDFGMAHSGLILTQAADSHVMHLYSLETLDLLATLKSPAHFTPITAVHWDIPKYEKPMISPSNHGSKLPGPHALTRQDSMSMSSLLATGDLSGNICLWYMTDILKKAKTKFHPSHTDSHERTLEPTCVLKGHDAKVTSLFVDKLLIVSGSADGWVKAWNPVNGHLVCVLNSGHIRGRELTEMTTAAVTGVAFNSMQCRGVASLGGVIRSWDFSPEANLAKERMKKGYGLVTKRPVHYSGGPKNKIQNDIRHSLEETQSLNRLRNQVKERHEQLQRRYNNLEGLNMNDMTDQELVEYVMMLSKEHEEQVAEHDSVQEVYEIQRLQELERQQEGEEEEEEKELRQLQARFGGAASSSSSSDAAYRGSSSSGGYLDDLVDERERQEEEDLVQRAIELSMLDMNSTEDLHGHNHENGQVHHHEYEHEHGSDLDHSFTPSDWDTSHIVDVDDPAYSNKDSHIDQEDEVIVRSILNELEQTEHHSANGLHVEVSTEEAWPGIGVSVSSSSRQILSEEASQDKGKGRSETAGAEREQPAKKAPMTWSMVARASKETQPVAGLSSSSASTSSSSLNQKPPAIIKQYASTATQEEIEDEDTQLARILSLSMVEK